MTALIGPWVEARPAPGATFTARDIAEWPPTVSVEWAAAALGISRATAYGVIRRNEFPARAIQVGGRIRIVTESLLAILTGRTDTARQLDG